MGLRVIVGLGNPGQRYQGTRHNLGFRVLDHLATAAASTWKKKRLFEAWTARQGELILVKPATFVNLSGRAARAVIDYYRLNADDLVVVADDVNLPAGKIRIRSGGGAGGHHGLESIIQSLGTRQFPRIRIGVGGSELDELTAHVLSRPGKSEEALYDQAVSEAIEAIITITAEGTEKAMNIFNRKITNIDEEATD